MHCSSRPNVPSYVPQSNASHHQNTLRPPYASLSMPVYSLSTRGDAHIHTLNLVTYASPIALQPPTYALGLYQHTLSRELMLQRGEGVLQILGEQHVGLFSLLGKTSGRDVDKLAALHAQGVQLTDFHGYSVIADCVGAMLLRVVNGPFAAGDHDVVLCQVQDSWVPTTAAAAEVQGVVGAAGVQGVQAETQVPTAPLYTGYLRAQGLIQ